MNRPFDPRPDAFELLRRAGYRRTWRDDLDEFLYDLRSNPGLATACAAGGFALGLFVTVGLALIIGPFL